MKQICGMQEYDDLVAGCFFLFRSTDSKRYCDNKVIKAATRYVTVNLSGQKEPP